MIHQIHNFYHNLEMDIHMIFLSYQMSSSFSFLSSGPKFVTITFQLTKISNILLQAHQSVLLMIYSKQSIILFLKSWSNWSSKLSKTLDSNTSAYRTLDKLHKINNTEFIWSFLHSYLLCHPSVLVMDDHFNLLNSVDYKLFKFG